MIPKALADMKPGMSIKVGQKYWMREFPTLMDTKLHKVKVIAINTLGDGTRQIRYRHNWPFPMDDDMLLSDFEKHMVKWTTQEIKYKGEKA